VVGYNFTLIFPFVKKRPNRSPPSTFEVFFKPSMKKTLTQMLCLGLLSTSFTIFFQQSIPKDNATNSSLSVNYYAVGDSTIRSFISRNNNFQKRFPSGNTTEPDVYSLNIAGNRYQLMEGDSITKGATPEISFSNRF
jgi:hypothetical protein